MTLPVVLQQNVSPGQVPMDVWNTMDLEDETKRDVTFLVTTTGSPTSLSVELLGAQALVFGGPVDPWGVLQTVSAPGFYTFSTHWVRYLAARVPVLSGGSSPTVTVTVAVKNDND